MSETDDWRRLLACKIGEILARSNHNPYRKVSFYELAPWGWHGGLRIGMGNTPLTEGASNDSPYDKIPGLPAPPEMGMSVVVRIVRLATPHTLVKVYADFVDWQTEEPSFGGERQNRPPKAPEIPEVLRTALSSKRSALDPRMIPANELDDWSSSRHRLQHKRFGTQLLIIAPYISAETADIAKENGVWFWDAAENYRLELPGVLVERIGGANLLPRSPKAVAIFAGKSGQVVRAILNGKRRFWTQLELSEVAGVSSGQTSKVVVRLVETKWCDRSDKGLIVTDTGGLIRSLADSWVLSGEVSRFRSAEELDKVIKKIAGYCRKHGHEYALSLPAEDPHQFNLLTAHVDGEISSVAIAAGLISDKAGPIAVRRMQDTSVKWGVEHKRVEGVGSVHVVSGLQRILDLLSSVPDDVNIGTYKLERFVEEFEGKQASSASESRERGVTFGNGPRPGTGPTQRPGAIK